MTRPLSRARVKLRRLYSADGRDFTIVAVPPPGWARMSEAEQVAQFKAERAAIAAEWARIRESDATPGDDS